MILDGEGGVGGGGGGTLAAIFRTSLSKSDKEFGGKINK